MKKYLLMSICIAAVSSSLLSACTAEDPAKSAIITGQNNHNWEASSVVLNDYLNNSGLFKSEIITSPEAGKDMSDFKPDFSKYDLIVLDYNGDSWPEATRNAFVEYVRNGGGVVVYHSADNTFRDWKEYNEIIGIGGWEGRDETDGPYVYEENGKIVKDMSEGPGGSHGEQHEFTVVTFDAEHPVMKGLPDTWDHARDELYDRLRGPAENLTVLATAFSNTETGGSGRNEPVLMTITYGKGRIFHTVLGHVGDEAVHPAVECPGFIATFLRGAEWAATGKVDKAPENFTEAEIFKNRNK